MKKQLILSAVVFGLACASVFAQGIDPVAMDRIDTIVQGKNNGDQIIDLRVQDDGLIKGDLGVGGNVAITGTVSATGASTYPAVSAGDHTVSTNIDFTVASITVTNGQIITLTSTYTELLNTGTAATTTTNTFAALSAAQVGRLFIIQAAAANTDSIAFAEAGILVSGGTLTLGASDGFTAIARDTNILRQTTAVMNN